MLMLPAAVLAAAAVAVTPVPPSNRVAAGEKVRVATTSLGDKTGVVVAADAESVTVSVGAGKAPVRIPLASVKRLEVARGRRTAVKEGAITGGLVGGALGALAVLYLSHALCEGGSDCNAEVGAYGIGVGIFGAGGAGLGALTGLAIKTDKWVRVPVSDLRVAVGPVADGAGVKVSLGWGRR